MPAVARSEGTDSVLSPDGQGKNCAFPLNTFTGIHTQERVSAEGVFVVVEGDKPALHKLGGCKIDDVQPLTSSSRVSAGGKKIARIGDMYGNNAITSGSSRVFIG